MRSSLRSWLNEHLGNPARFIRMRGATEFAYRSDGSPLFS